MGKKYSRAAITFISIIVIFAFYKLLGGGNLAKFVTRPENKNINNSVASVNPNKTNNIAPVNNSVAAVNPIKPNNIATFTPGKTNNLNLLSNNITEVNPGKTNNIGPEKPTTSVKQSAFSVTQKKPAANCSGNTCEINFDSSNLKKLPEDLDEVIQTVGSSGMQKKIQAAIPKKEIAGLIKDAKKSSSKASSDLQKTINPIAKSMNRSLNPAKKDALKTLDGLSKDINKKSQEIGTMAKSNTATNQITQALNDIKNQFDRIVAALNSAGK